MEASDENVNGLARYLALTLDPDPSKRRHAENFLQSVEPNPNYGLLVLRLVGDGGAEATVRVAAAIAFKNYAKRTWASAEGNDEAERAQIRDALVELMLRAPRPVQKQLSDAISVVGRCDFPARWPGLIAQMVARFADDDFHVINGVLQTAHSLFKRYRYEFKSQELWTEIAFVLAHFARPLTDLFRATLDLCRLHHNDADALRVIYSSLLLICKVFLSLNSQDLPEYFEDNMHVWMPNLLTLLQTKLPILDTADLDEPGIVEQVREAAVECAGLYASKYSEEFLPYAPGFVTAAWNALLDTGPQPKYDALVSASLKFLANVAEKKKYSYLFEDPNVLGQICEKVIIPNMEFRDSDQELFEDNPEEYIRRDIEGSDVETRRRAACDLVKVLSVNYEEKIFQIFGQYVQAMLARSASSPTGEHWRSKDVALFLITSMSERGRTARTGVTATSNFVNLSSFFQEHILPDLHSEINVTPVLKADAIKYLITFRSLLPKEHLLVLLPVLIHYLDAESYVVVSYAAACIEKVLPLLGMQAEISTIAPKLMQALLQCLDKPGHGDNDYVMKCIMRTLYTANSGCMPAMGNALTKFANVLIVIAKNPSRPNFNHYLFECISFSIRIVCKVSPNAIESFESTFFPIFQEILQQEVQEFMPYVFQILSLMVEQRCNASGGLSEDSPYLALVSCLLTPPLWDRSANVRALVRLLSSLIRAAHQQLLKDNRLNGMLGVFQKLIASKLNDQEGFALIQCMLQYIPEEQMRPYLKQILSLMFQRLSSSKTARFIRGLIVFLGFFCLRFGPDELVETLDATQPQLFGMYCERILVPDLQKVSGATDVKMTTVGYTKLLCECRSLYAPDGKYRHLWCPIMQALIALFELPTDESAQAEELVDPAEESAYQPAYCQLAGARQDAPDVLKNASEPREFLARSLGEVSASRGGALTALLDQLSGDHRAILDGYLRQFGVLK